MTRQAIAEPGGPIQTPWVLMRSGMAREDLRCVNHPDRPWDGVGEFSGTCVCADCRDFASRALQACAVVLREQAETRQTRKTA